MGEEENGTGEGHMNNVHTDVGKYQSQKQAMREVGTGRGWQRYFKM